MEIKDRIKKNTRKKEKEKTSKWTNAKQDIAQEKQLIETSRLLNASSGHAGVTCLECRAAAF